MQWLLLLFNFDQVLKADDEIILQSDTLDQS